MRKGSLIRARPSAPAPIISSQNCCAPTSLDLEAAIGILRIFQTTGAGQMTALPSARAILVTDYATQIGRLKRLLDLVDKPQPAASVEVVSLKAAEPGPLVDRVTKLLTQLAKAEGRLESDKVFLTPPGR